jgi:hypothetical protein
MEDNTLEDLIRIIYLEENKTKCRFSLILIATSSLNKKIISDRKMNFHSVFGVEILYRAKITLLFLLYL